jgi:hypothetical protein
MGGSNRRLIIVVLDMMRGANVTTVVKEMNAVESHRLY